MKMTDRKKKKVSSDAVLQTTLYKIVKNQKQLIEDVKSIRRQQDMVIQSAIMLRRKINSQMSEFVVNSTNEVRNVETKVLGLTAVVDNVQDRLIQLELNGHGCPNYHLSTTSLSSTDDEHAETTPSLDFSETGITKIDKNRPDQVFKQPAEKTLNYQKWLQENHLALVKGINPATCLLLDYLLQDNVISESDEDDISSHRTRKDKTRELLFKMRHADNERVGVFVKHLKKDFPQLVENVSKDDETGEDNTREVCIACDVVKQVNVDDAADVLYAHAIIDGDLHEQIWRSSSKRKGWSRLLKEMDRSRLPKCLSILGQALEQKYPQICQRLSECDCRSLACFCFKRKTVSSSTCRDVRGRTAPNTVCAATGSQGRMLSCRSKRFTELYRLHMSQKKTVWADKK